MTGAFSGGHSYYTHHEGAGRESCGFYGVRADLLEQHVLGYLYTFFTDQPAFEAAVRQAMPSSEQRNALESELKRARAELAKVEGSIGNLVRAVENGADPAVLIERQDALRTARTTASERVESLESELATMPTAALVERQASAVRLMLARIHTGKQWHKQSFDDVRAFLRFLFGDNAHRAGFGIFVSREAGRWRVEFKGRVRIEHRLQDGVPTTGAFRRAVRARNKLLQTELEIALDRADREADREAEATKKEVRKAKKARNGVSKPEIAYSYNLCLDARLRGYDLRSSLQHPDIEDHPNSLSKF